MPTGVSSLFYPQQPEPLCGLALDNSYFLVRLYEAQAFFEAGWLVKPGFLMLSSSIEGSFRPEFATKSLHCITAFQKNSPCHLGLGVNLTDWLPARAADNLKIELRYTVVQDTPFRTLVDQMGQIGLVAKVSLIRPDWAVATKISEITGRLLSYLLGEGSAHEIFPLKVDLNVANLKTGYYVVIGSSVNQGWPQRLCIDEQGRLTDERGHLLLHHSYVVLEVLALPRRGEETARNEPWWELLQTGKEQALAAYPTTSQEVKRVQEDWRSILIQVQTLARKDPGFLLTEVREMIHLAQDEVSRVLQARTTLESSGSVAYPPDWQVVLGVETEGELHQSVTGYLDTLNRSRWLMDRYGLQGE